ncbi:MAG: epoxyqueuosine reductase QueH [Candidatus Shapirobacteria bacterium]|nr:epoxyqueuosine reductase QueH [Candidatus Shapirobacteria bacterium]
MKILIHTCCADCLLKMADSLKGESIEVVGYFYNPNIHPRAEYLARLKAAQKIGEENKIKLVVPDWSPKEWFREIKKGGSLKNKNRCENCWKLRLGKTFEYAKKNGFEVISSTLVTSHYQNKNKIIEIGENLEEKFGIKFLVPENVSSELKTTGFYKQNYCGCCYSLVEAWSTKFC